MSAQKKTLQHTQLQAAQRIQIDADVLVRQILATNTAYAARFEVLDRKSHDGKMVDA